MIKYFNWYSTYVETGISRCLGYCRRLRTVRHLLDVSASGPLTGDEAEILYYVDPDFRAEGRARALPLQEYELSPAKAFYARQRRGDAEIPSGGWERKLL